jgi:hypothetical protein
MSNNNLAENEVRFTLDASDRLFKILVDIDFSADTDENPTDSEEAGNNPRDVSLDPYRESVLFRHDQASDDYAEVSSDRRLGREYVGRLHARSRLDTGRDRDRTQNEYSAHSQPLVNPPMHS